MCFPGSHVWPRRSLLQLAQSLSLADAHFHTGPMPPGTIAHVSGQEASETVSRPLKAPRLATAEVEKGAKEAALELWRGNLRGGAIEESLRQPRDASWWTGRKPAECPGFCRESGCMTSLPLPVRINRSHTGVQDPRVSDGA